MFGFEYIYIKTWTTVYILLVDVLKRDDSCVVGRGGGGRQFVLCGRKKELPQNVSPHTQRIPFNILFFFYFLVRAFTLYKAGKVFSMAFFSYQGVQPKIIR